ncbi:MAG: hypothetical protein ACXABG_12875 [Promethearchaeota archaeon]|jgi:hypothetical protein
MDSGRVLLTDKELSLMKKSNISLTEVGTSIDDFKTIFVIPLTQIKKAYNLLIQKIYVVKIETRDGYLFSVTTANSRSSGKEGSIHLSELINSTTILANNRRKMSQSTNITKIEPDLKVCSNCGEKLDHFWNFCNNCGKELALHKKI